MSQVLKRAREIVSKSWGQKDYVVDRGDGEPRFCLAGACGAAYEMNSNRMNYQEVGYDFVLDAFDHVQEELYAIAEVIADELGWVDKYNDSLWRIRPGEEVEDDDGDWMMSDDMWSEQVTEFIAIWNDAEERKVEDVIYVIDRAQEKMST